MRILALVAIGLSTLVYRSITSNYFHADDFGHLQDIVNGPFVRFVVQTSGGHLYLLRNTIFYLFHYLFDMRPERFFAVVLVTHLVNVWLLFEVVRTLTRSARLACFGATLWGTSPVNEGALGWYSVYGQVLAATAVLAVLLRLARHVVDQRPLAWTEALAWYATLLAAANLFGVGIGITVVFPVVLSLVLPGDFTPPPARRLFLSLPVVVLALYAAVVGLRGWLSSEPTGAFELFLLRQVIGFAPIVTFVNLLRAGVGGLVGSFWVPRGALLGYASAAYAVAALAVLAASGRTTRRLLVAFALLAAAAYATIAAGRTIIGALGTEPRYHYLAPIFLTLILCLVLAHAAVALPRIRWPDAVLAVGLSAIVVSYARSVGTIDHFDADRRETERVLATIASAVEVTPVGKAVYLPNRPFLSAGPLAAGSFAGWAGVFILFHPDGEAAGRPVYFVARNPDELAIARPDTRLARVIVRSAPF